MEERWPRNRQARRYRQAQREFYAAAIDTFGEAIAEQARAMPAHRAKSLVTAAASVLLKKVEPKPQRQKVSRPRAWGSGVLGSGAAVVERQRVYIIGATGDPVKIGIALNPHGRRSELQVGHHRALNLYFEAEATDARAVEREAHRRLSDQRLSGEWFDVSPDQAIQVVRAIIAGD